jgi:two-component system nitrate/nitrite response regulator NarL
MKRRTARPASDPSSGLATIPTLPTRLSATRRVMIITDRSIHAAALQGILDGESDFAVVGVAATYAVAVHRAQDLQPDLLIVDLAMHALNERLLLHALRLAAPEAVLVVINGTGAAQDEAQAYDDGADVYCDAFVGASQLVALLRTAKPWGTPS